PNISIGNNQDLMGMFDCLGRQVTKLIDCLAKRGPFCKGPVNDERSESAKILDGLKLAARKDRRVKKELPAMLRRLLQKIALAADMTFQRSHQVFPQIVKRRV